MSSTLQSTDELRNAAPSRTPEHGDLCHAAQLPERSDLTPVPSVRTAAESPVENSSHLSSCTVQAPVVRDSRGVGSDAGVSTLIERSRTADLDAPKFKLGTPTKDGFKFGPGRFVASKSIPETNRPRIVAGQSLTLHGFELLDAKDCFVSWHECFLDACDAIKAYRGAAKVVRCLDRALLRLRMPKKRSA